MLIQEKFQVKQMKVASEEIQVKNGIDFHLPVCLNLNGFNSWNLPKPGVNLAHWKKCECESES